MNAEVHSVTTLPCEKCPFGGPRVGSKGDPKAPIVFVAESPGNEELKAGIPLIGPSGRLFHQYVPDDDSIYILNALQCFPRKRNSLSPQKMDRLLNQAVSVCRDRLLSQVQAHPRRLIVAMGNAAQRSLTGDYSLKIMTTRGTLIESDMAELGIYPILHVAALMHGTGNLNQWRRDVEYALYLGNGGKPREHLQAQTKFVGEDTLLSERHKIYGELSREPELTGDIETSDLHPLRGYILSVGVTPDSKPDVSYCFHPSILQEIKPLLENTSIRWNWHNGKFDVRWLRLQGIDARVDDDTMLMSYTLDESTGIHDLETIGKDLLHAPDYKDMLKPWLPNKKTSYANVPYDILGKYQGIDTSTTAQLRPILRQSISRNEDLNGLYHNVLIPASEMLSYVEDNGFYVDKERLEMNSVYYQEALDKSSQNMNVLVREATGRDVSFNPSSTSQVAGILYNVLGFPKLKRNSTDVATINRLQERFGNNAFFQGLLDHRKAVKMYGTYVKGLSKHICYDGRIHPTYKIHGTRTGRLACSDPNLQNIPRDARMKSQFAAAPGNYLIEVDLSQAELRVLACVSEDPTLCGLFNSGEDIHTDLCLHLWGEEGTGEWANLSDNERKERRVRAKNVNFGIVYGITAHGLEARIPGDIREADKMLSAWHTRYSLASEFISKCRQTVSLSQVITTAFGRKKRPTIVTKENKVFLENEAANFPPQSMASDITLLSAVRCWPTLKKWGVGIVNLVHDSIIMEVPVKQQHRQQEIIELVKESMRVVPQEYGLTQVPFESDASIGTHWGEVKEL